MASAAILAGGRAIRFGGRDKSALVVAGRRIIDRQIDVLAEVVDEILIVGASEGSRPSTPNRARAIRAIPDRIEGCGPLGGLETALREAHDSALLLLACDMPFVTTPFLAHLVALADEADIVVPRTGRGYHPLCAVYARACEHVVHERLLAGKLAMIDLLDRVRIRVVGNDEVNAFGNPDRLLMNVNSPGDYAAIEKAESHKV